MTATSKGLTSKTFEQPESKVCRENVFTFENKTFYAFFEGITSNLVMGLSEVLNLIQETYLFKRYKISSRDIKYARI